MAIAILGHRANKEPIETETRRRECSTGRRSHGDPLGIVFILAARFLLLFLLLIIYLFLL